MIALWILGGVAALLGIICCIPVGVTGEYSQAGARAVAHVGPFRILLYPRPPKKPGEAQGARPEKAQKPKKPKKTRKTKQKQPAGEETPKQGGGVSMFREIIGMVLEAQAEVRNRLRIQELTMYLTVGGRGDDPAKSAMLYGSAWAAVGGLMPLLERAFRIEKRDIQANVDFLSEKTTIYARATAKITVGAILRMGGYYGVRGLKLYRKHKKKGGNEHGTSNQ